MDLLDYRRQMDEIDNQLVELFQKRMNLAGEIAAYKKEKGLPILDAGREREKIKAVCSRVSPDMRNFTSVLYSSLFELSRSYQSQQMQQFTDLSTKISKAISETTPLFPQDVSVGICGVEGSFAQLACEKLFRTPFVLYFNHFEGIFSAVEQGLCQYGIVPIEHSTAGSEKKIYDLMMQHGFSVVRSVRLKIDHNLLAKPNTRLEEVREIIANEQTVGQCSAFLKALNPDIRVTVCENTAIAAKVVADSPRNDIAAICSHNYAEMYGLKCLQSSVQDSENNHTRFFCISKNLEVYPGANCTSIILSVPNKPGALYKLLARFYALGINITKLESRTIPSRDFEILFYLDLETSIYSQEFAQIICELSASSEAFTYLGSYSEVV